ncbi:hypothetical protein MBLNU457_6528t1 [Dothideomycetes sp. NU457]
MVAFSTAIATAAATTTALQLIYGRQLVDPVDSASPQSITVVTRWSTATATYSTGFAQTLSSSDSSTLASSASTSSRKSSRTTSSSEHSSALRHYCSTMTVAPSIVVSAQEINGAAYMNLVNAQQAPSCAFDHVKKITDSSAATSIFTPDREWATHRASESYGFQVTSPSGMVTKASTKAGEV